MAKDAQLVVRMDREDYAAIESFASVRGYRSMGEWVREVVARALAAGALSEGDLDDVLGTVTLGKKVLTRDVPMSQAMDRADPADAIFLSALNHVQRVTEAIEERDPRKAILFANGAGTALHEWSEDKAKRHGTSVRRLLGKGR